MSIMERLYEGEIHPCEEIVPQSDAYAEASRYADMLMREISEQLSPEEYKKIEDLCLQWSTMTDVLAKESFKYGLSIGMELIEEAEKLPYLKEEW